MGYWVAIITITKTWFLATCHLVVSGDHYSTAEVIRCTPAGREHYYLRQCHDAWQEHLPTSTLCTFYMQRCSLSATYSTAGCGLRLRLIEGQLQVSPEVPWTICWRLGDPDWVGWVARDSYAAITSLTRGTHVLIAHPSQGTHVVPGHERLAIKRVTMVDPIITRCHTAPTPPRPPFNCPLKPRLGSVITTASEIYQ